MLQMEKEIILGLVNEKESQIFKNLIMDNNLMTKKELEIEIGKQTQIIKTWISDHFKNSNKTWLPSELKHQIIPSQDFLALQMNKPNNNQILSQFDSKSVNLNTFIYSNNIQTITCNGNYWRMIYLIKHIPRNKVSYNFKIEKSFENSIMIGICPFSNLNNTYDCYKSMGAYAYYGYDGKIYYNYTDLQSNGGSFKAGMIIRMTVNLSEYTIEWLHENKILHKMNLDKSNVNQEMYPCLHLYNHGDSVSILNN